MRKPKAAKTFVIQEGQRPAFLRLLRYIRVTDIETFNALTTWEDETRRWVFNPAALLRYERHRLFEPFTEIAWTDKRNLREAAWLTERAEEFQDRRATLIRLSLPTWVAKAGQAGRTKAQKDNMTAAVLAIALRAAHEETDNVLMSWDSMEAMMTSILNSRPGRSSISRIFEWLGSDKSPVKVTLRGQQGKFRKSTTIKISISDDIDFRHAFDDDQAAEQTAGWLAENADTLGEVYADEALRRRELPERKARHARTAGIHAGLELFGTDSLFLQVVNTPGNVKATSLSLTNSIYEEDPPETSELDWSQTAREIRSGRLGMEAMLDGLDLSLPRDLSSALDGEDPGPPNTPDPYPSKGREKILA